MRKTIEKMINRDGSFSATNTQFDEMLSLMHNRQYKRGAIAFLLLMKWIIKIGRYRYILTDKCKSALEYETERVSREVNLLKRLILYL